MANTKAQLITLLLRQAIIELNVELAPALTRANVLFGEKLNEKTLKEKLATGFNYFSRLYLGSDCHCYCLETLPDWQRTSGPNSTRTRPGGCR
jgi:hypothetical protein